MFFSFDGTDGVGKSTQIELFKHWLIENGHEVVLCRDPGSSLLGERLRDLLLEKHDVSSTVCLRDAPWSDGSQMLPRCLGMLS